MWEERSYKKEFHKSADKNAHDKAFFIEALSKEQRQEFESKQELERKEIEEKVKEQGQNRNTKLAEAKSKIKLDSQDLAYRPWWVRKDRLTEDRLNELAERAVEVNNKAEISALKEQHELDQNRYLATQGFWAKSNRPHEHQKDQTREPSDNFTNREQEIKDQFWGKGKESSQQNHNRIPLEDRTYKEEFNSRTNQKTLSNNVERKR